MAAVFSTHEQARGAIRELQTSGFELNKLSIVGRDCHTEEHVVGCYWAGDRMLYWGRLGAYWSGFWGLLSGSAIFGVPGIGPLLVAGPLVMWIVERARCCCRGRAGHRPGRRTVQRRHSKKECLAIRNAK